jgi:predicted nucleotidyltransferase
VNRLLRELSSIASSLHAAGARFAVVGGLAVSARAEARFTRDVDLAVAVDSDLEADRLLRVLREAGYELLELHEQERIGRLAGARLAPAGGRADELVVDLLFASTGIEREIVDAAEQLELAPGVGLPVAVVGDLLAMKLLARDDRSRPTDADDLRRLLAAARPNDLERARQAVRWIEERGAARGRKLSSGLEALLAAREG